MDRSLWGVALVDEKGSVLYGRNQRQLFIPASNTKIVVAAVASALLPPDWTVKTSLYATGRWPTACCRATSSSTAGVTPPSASAASRPTRCARALRDRLRSPGFASWPRSARARHPRGPGRPRRRRQLLRADHRSTRAGRGSTSTGGTPRRSRRWASTTTASTSTGVPARRRRAGADHDVAGRGRRDLREPHGDGGRGRRVGHRRPLLPRARHAARLGGRHGGARSADPDRIVRDAGPQPLHRSGAAAGAGRSGHRDHRHDPLDHRLDAISAGPERTSRSPRSPRVRSANGCSRSSTGVRTGSPRWCSSSSGASSAAPARGTRDSRSSVAS